MKLLIDADVLLEALLNRQFYGDQTSLIWNILENNLVEAYITNMGLNHIEGFFSHCHQEVVDSIHEKLCDLTYIYQVTDDLIEKTRLSPLLDFESALEVEVAQELKVDAIITHYPQNFQNHHYQDQQISILSLEDLHQIIQLEKSLDVDLYSNNTSLPDQIFSLEKETFAVISSQITAIEIIYNLNRQKIRISTGRVKQDNVNEVSKLIETAQNFSEKGLYNEALKSYLQAAELAPENGTIQIGIALCLDKFQRYKDVLDMANYALSNADNQKQRAMLFNLIGGAFHELGVINYNDNFVKSALDCYDEAINYDPYDVIPAWNKVDLLISWSKKKTIENLGEYYINEIQPAWVNFVKFARNSWTNFKDYREHIKQDIQKAIQKVPLYYREFFKVGFAELFDTEKY